MRVLKNTSENLTRISSMLNNQSMLTGKILNAEKKIDVATSKPHLEVSISILDEAGKEVGTKIFGYELDKKSKDIQNDIDKHVKLVELEMLNKEKFAEEEKAQEQADITIAELTDKK